MPVAGIIGFWIVHPCLELFRTECLPGDRPLFRVPRRSRRTSGNLLAERGVALQTVTFRFLVTQMAFGAVQRQQVRPMRITHGELRGGGLLRKFFITIVATQAAVAFHGFILAREPLCMATRAGHIFACMEGIHVRGVGPGTCGLLQQRHPFFGKRPPGTLLSHKAEALTRRPSVTDQTIHLRLSAYVGTMDPRRKRVWRRLFRVCRLVTGQADGDILSDNRRVIARQDGLEVAMTGHTCGFYRTGGRPSFLLEQTRQGNTEQQ